MKALALLAATAALLALAASASPGRAQRGGDPARGRALYVAGCARCHGDDARGIPTRGPDLHGAGALAADFYLRTGRMPLAEPRDEPVRAKPAYSSAEIEDLVAYLASLGGPPVPAVRPDTTAIARGRNLFATNCAGCHQIAARGGVLTGGIAPALEQATPTQIAEAIRLGPYLMPRFSVRELPPEDVDAIAAYVLSMRDPPNRGGWGIGDIGPIPEGMVAWLIGLAALIGVARLIGEPGP